MTREAYERMNQTKKCMRYFDKNEKKNITVVVRFCDNCVKNNNSVGRI